jgi:hypothetical protein
VKPGHTKVLSAATLTFLRPLVRLFLRNGFSAKTFFELAKQTYVEVARDECGVRGKKASISRIAILTGLTRKEVQLLLTNPEARDTAPEEQYNRAARVIGGWLKDPAFSDGKGHPVSLQLYGKRGSFSALVKRYSGDMPVRAIFDELVHVGAVQELKDGRICLRSRGYIPQKGDAEKLAILGTDTADLIATIDYNLYQAPSKPRFQRKLMYDNVPQEAAKDFQILAAAQGQELLETLDRWLSHRDRDVNPSSKGTGRVRVGLGVYQFEEDVDTKPGSAS